MDWGREERWGRYMGRIWRQRLPQFSFISQPLVLILRPTGFARKPALLASMNCNQKSPRQHSCPKGVEQLSVWSVELIFTLLCSLLNCYTSKLQKLLLLVGSPEVARAWSIVCLSSVYSIIIFSFLQYCLLDVFFYPEPK